METADLSDLASGVSDYLDKMAVEAVMSELTNRLSDNNTSGKCVDCNKEIPEERLDIFPNCECCAPCQNKRDKEIKSPFGNLLIEDES